MDINDNFFGTCDNNCKVVNGLFDGICVEISKKKKKIIINHQI